MVRLVYHRLDFYSGHRRIYHVRLLLVWQAGLQVFLSGLSCPRSTGDRFTSSVKPPIPFLSYMFILYQIWEWATRGLHLLVPGALSEEKTLVTRTTLKIYGPVSTNYRQGTSSILESDEKLGTDPAAVGGWRCRWNPCFKNLIPVCGELTCWHGTGRPNLSYKTEFSGPNWDKEKICFLFR